MYHFTGNGTCIHRTNGLLHSDAVILCAQVLWQFTREVSIWLICDTTIWDTVHANLVLHIQICWFLAVQDSSVVDLFHCESATYRSPTADRTNWPQNKLTTEQLPTLQPISLELYMTTNCITKIVNSAGLHQLFLHVTEAPCNKVERLQASAGVWLHKFLGTAKILRFSIVTDNMLRFLEGLKEYTLRELWLPTSENVSYKFGNLWIYLQFWQFHYWKVLLIQFSILIHMVLTCLTQGRFKKIKPTIIKETSIY